MGTLHYIVNKAEKKVLYLGKNSWTFNLDSFQIKGKVTDFKEMREFKYYYPYETGTFIIDDQDKLYKTIEIHFAEIHEEKFSEEDKTHYGKLCDTVVSFCNGKEVCIMYDFQDFIDFLFENGYKQYSVFEEDDDFFGKRDDSHSI